MRSLLCRFSVLVVASLAALSTTPSAFGQMQCDVAAEDSQPTMTAVARWVDSTPFLTPATIAVATAKPVSKSRVFTSVYDALDQLSAVKFDGQMENVLGNTEVGITWSDQTPTISVGGVELQNLQVICGDNVIEVHSMSLLNQDVVVTTFAINNRGRLVINTADLSGSKAARVTIDIREDGTVRARASKCRCWGGDGTTVKRARGCTNRECDNLTDTCHTAGTPATCSHRASQEAEEQDGDFGEADGR